MLLNECGKIDRNPMIILKILCHSSFLINVNIGIIFGSHLPNENTCYNLKIVAVENFIELIPSKMVLNHMKCKYHKYLINSTSNMFMFPLYLQAKLGIYAESDFGGW